MNSEINTKYLIINEDNIDWVKLSSDPNRYFSLAEVRIFRKRINWFVYLTNHPDVYEDNLRIASKFFDGHVWKYLSDNYKLSEGFIEDYVDNLNWIGLFKNSPMSAEFIMKYKEKWEHFNFSLILKNINNNIFIDTTSDDFSELMLLLNLN